MESQRDWQQSLFYCSNIGGDSYWPGNQYTENKRHYQQDSSVNLSGNNFYVRNEIDVQSLAIEIASPTKSKQRGTGFRMA